MEELAKKLITEIDIICAGYHYYRQVNVIEKVIKLQSEIQQFITFFLQGNIFGMEEQEYSEFCQYVLLVLKDYAEAMVQKDMVLMVDTLDYGLRELVMLYVENPEGINE